MSISVTTRRMSAPVLMSRRSPQGACLLLLVCTFACLLIGCSGSGDRMRQQLQELQARNQSDSLMTDDSLATALCTWFDSHGTPNERMLAHYLMGRTWADKGEAPQALEAYHTAAECADTTAADCDYSILTRIHAQSANLFYEQQMPFEMVQQLDLMYAAAENANDTLSKISSIEWKSVALDYLDEKESSLELLIAAYNAYMATEHQERAMRCVPNIIDHLVTLSQFTDAKIWIDTYEKHVAHLQAFSDFYFYYKGKYYYGVNKYDSARFVLEKFLESAQSSNDFEAAYSALYRLYEITGNTDSIAKYAVLSYKTSEERFKESNADELRHMQSLYNYSRNQAIAHKKTIESTRNRHLFVIAVLIAFFILFISSAVVILLRRKRKAELQRLDREYHEALEAQEQAKYDLMQLQRHEYEALLQQKQFEIANRQETIDRLYTSVNPQESLEKRLAETDIYKRFLHLTRNVQERVYVDDWKALEKMMNLQLPNFHSALYSHTHLDSKDYHLCILIRLHFSLSEIGILLSETPQYLSKRRKFLLQKLYHQDGKPEIFDKIVKSII